MGKTCISTHLWFYLLGSCIVLLACMYNFTDLLRYPTQIFTIFVLGALGIIIYDLTMKSPGIIRWGLILLVSGITLLAIHDFPDLVESYLSALREYPYVALGFTAMVLGALLLFIPALVLLDDFHKRIMKWLHRGED